MKYIHKILFICLVPLSSLAQTSLTTLHNGVGTSLRGLAVAGDSTIWVSGSKGFVGHSDDLGKSWHFFTIAGYDSAEFRDIEIIDDHSILVMSSINPACILKTNDNGTTWKEVFRDNSGKMFLDAMDFQNGQCVCIGDPVENKMVLLFSSDSGNIWTLKNNLQIPDSTAAFAASGSVVKWIDPTTIVFATGGKTSNLYMSYDSGATWRSVATPILCGQPSAGIFTMDFISAKTGVVAGGDYTLPDAHEKNIYYTENGGKAFKPINCINAGYISGVKFTGKKNILTCGTNGVYLFDIATGNETKISNEGFNTIAILGKNIFLAGNNGKVALMQNR